MTEYELKKGEVLIHEGDKAGGMFYLMKGSLEVLKVKGDKLQKIGTIQQGELVGEMSFLDEEPRCATVKASMDCLIREIPTDKFKLFFDKQPNWYRALVKTLLERLRRANKRVKI